MPTSRQAWEAALYGTSGFFRREAPADHFRTSAHASPLFARAIARLCHESGLDAVMDVGAGRGELLTALHEADPGLRLLGVEVADRPADLPPSIAWSSSLPEEIDGLVLANEWLDNVPCDIVEAGEEVTDEQRAWMDTWWPPAETGTRCEVGIARDRAWADVVRRVRRGIAIAIDYGHTRDDRPPFGSLRSYLRGHEVDVVLDGSRDVTADVAVDAVAAACEGRLLRQRDALRALDVTAARPAIELAHADPAAYLRALAEATEAAELTAQGGLGDFWWIVTSVGWRPWPSSSPSE